MSERYKLCESCGSEFQPRVEACLDCGGPLVEVELGRHLPPRPRREVPPPPPTVEYALTAADQPSPVRRDVMDRIGPLARKLRTREIRCDLVGDEGGGGRSDARYTLFVAHADLDRAQAVEQEFLAEEVPDAESYVDLDTDGCPACGAPRTPGAVECGECGLTLDFAPEDLAEMTAEHDEDGEAGEPVENSPP